jgi:hypothetical protein
MEPAGTATRCPWLFVERDALGSLSTVVDMKLWQLDSTVRHPADREGNLYLFRRKAGSSP